MKLSKKFLATTLMSASLLVNVSHADPLYMDLATFGIYDDTTAFPTPGDADFKTNLFDFFTSDPLSPTSVYTDIDATPGINTGDSVSDSVSGLGVLGLGTLGGGTDSEFFGTAWDMFINWDLSGSVVVAPDASNPSVINYLGNLNTGTFSFDIKRLGIAGLTEQLFEDVLTLDLVSATGSIPTDSKQAVTFTMEVTSALPGVFFNQAGVDFADTINNGGQIRFTANADLFNLNAPLNQVGNSNVYTREASLGSVDFRTVSEPTTLGLLGLGLLAFAARSRLRK